MNGASAACARTALHGDDATDENATLNGESPAGERTALDRATAGAESTSVIGVDAAAGTTAVTEANAVGENTAFPGATTPAESTAPTGVNTAVESTAPNGANTAGASTALDGANPASESTALNGANTVIESTAGDGTNTTKGKDAAALDGAQKAASKNSSPSSGNNGADQPAGPTVPVQHQGTRPYGATREMIRIADLNPAYNEIVNLSGKTLTPCCMLCYSSEPSYGPLLHACGCPERTHASCHGILSPRRQDTCPRCSVTINYEWAHQVQMSSEDVIAEQASLRTAAFEQQHEDRSHALELHSDQIVEHIAWYSGMSGSDRLEWHSDLRVTGGFETLKLPVPRSSTHARPRC